MRWRRLVLAVLGVVAIGTTTASAQPRTARIAGVLRPLQQRAAEPLFLGWTGLLPGLPLTHRASTEPDCADGSADCVDATLGEMRRRFTDLSAGCDHNAVFALTYIRVTEAYRLAALAGYFEEPAFLAHEDAVFARMYFETFDQWAAGRSVPRAWQIALGAALDRRVAGIGNILLGINAHVNRDMPFMLAALGIVKPDGTSRKRDHDAFNQLLSDVYDDVLPEIARRFDATTAWFDSPQTTLDNTVTFQILPLWRELVWRNAELLVSAPTPEARAQVAAAIEQYAAAQAELIRAQTSYPGLFGTSSAARDAQCAAAKQRTRRAGNPPRRAGGVR